jgi:DNA-binding GntR family transcriptional regulator
MVNADLTSSVELVYQRTRHAILTGDYPPGSALRLQDLASRSGVSMIPVREALRLLEAEGFVESIPDVTPVDLDKARRLNTKIVRQFVQRGHAEYEDHRAFHFALYEPSGSKWLLRLIGIVWDHTERYRRVGAARVKAGEARAEHELILDRIEARDVEGALAALTVHLEGSVERFRELFAEDPTLFTGGTKPSAGDGKVRPDGRARIATAERAAALDEAAR